jgi:hypothetical protein
MQYVRRYRGSPLCSCDQLRRASRQPSSAAKVIAASIITQKAKVNRTYNQQILDSRFNGRLPGADKGLIIGVSQPRVLDQIFKVAVAASSPGDVRAEETSIRWIDALSRQPWEGGRQQGDVLGRADCEVLISLIAGISPVLIVSEGGRSCWRYDVR